MLNKNNSISCITIHRDRPDRAQPVPTLTLVLLLIPSQLMMMVTPTVAPTAKFVLAIESTLVTRHSSSGMAASNFSP